MPVPPFELCSYELFERYAETILRKSDPDLWSGSEKERNLGQGRYMTRPDFIRPKAGIILDCKYKHFGGRITDQERVDVYQIVAYSRHNGVLNEIRHAGGPDKTSEAGAAVSGCGVR
jgi:McrBC 5-methylcytosine restriction system component